MSTITVTRLDPLGNVGTINTAPVILTREIFPTIVEAAAAIRARGVPLTAEHEARIMAEPQATVFAWREFVECGACAAMMQVQYHVVVDA